MTDLDEGYRVTDSGEGIPPSDQCMDNSCMETTELLRYHVRQLFSSGAPGVEQLSRWKFGKGRIISLRGLQKMLE